MLKTVWIRTINHIIQSRLNNSDRGVEETYEALSFNKSQRPAFMNFINELEGRGIFSRQPSTKKKSKTLLRLNTNLMNTIKFILLFAISATGHPIFAQNQSFQVSTSLAIASERFLGFQNGLKPSEKGSSKFNIFYELDNSSSQLAINYDEYNQLTFDGSYFQYTKGIATFGVGVIDRNWSFSERTSLILSNNARPSKSVFLKLKNKFGFDRLSSEAVWSFEIFNGFTEGALNSGKSMLLGARAIISPIEGLDFELVQTSQWGGKAYNSGISALGAALLFDTNRNLNSNINKMAGFGVSYSMPSSIMPLRIYGQIIGEDEAGSLPSCNAYLAGIEWTITKNKYPTIVGIETVDTRIDTTSHGHCGPNTMYNNNTYKYTNYGKAMGALIDTESTSFGIFVQSQITQKIDIEFAMKSMNINDNNWSAHRLSSKRQSGLINSLGVNWNEKNISFNGSIFSQSLNLDKANIKSGFGIGFSSSIIF